MFKINEDFFDTIKRINEDNCIVIYLYYTIPYYIKIFHSESHAPLRFSDFNFTHHFL